jgi:hypothetical protein
LAFDSIRESLFKSVNKSAKTGVIERNQSFEDKELIGFVRGKLEDVRAYASRISHEGVWLTNIAYVLGFDFVKFDSSLRQFRPSAYAGQFMRNNRVSVNTILPRMQNRASKLCKNPPRYDVIPKTMSDEDKEAARLGLHIINSTWDEQQINRKRLELVNWVQQCGHAYLKTCWDKQLGPKMPVFDQETGEARLEPIGDIRIDVISPFEVFPDPIAKSWDECGWVVQARIRPISYFRDQYGELGGQVEPEDVWLTSLQYETRINSFNNQGGASTSVNSVIKNAAIELSYYEKPTYKNPKGRMIVCASNVLLKNDELPIDEICFQKFDDVIVAGKYYSESVVTHARPLQDQLNRLMALRADWQNKMLTGKYIAARGHGLMKEALNDQSGEVVEYDHVPNAPPPTAMQIPLIPQYAYTEEDSLINKIDDIFGINEVSRGQLPSAGIPAIGMQFLVEQDDTRIGVVTEGMEYAYAGVGRQILKYAEKYYDTPRLLKMAGKSMEYTVKSFVGEDLLGNTNTTVIRGSTLPGSKTLKRQEIINLHQQGYFGNPQDPKVLQNVLSQLEYGDVQEAWKERSLDMAQITKCIAMIEMEVKPPVHEADNHILFYQELNNLRKSEKFDKFSDLSKAILLEVMEDHLQEMVNIAAPTTTNAPSMDEQTAAQEHEAELQAQLGTPDDVMAEAMDQEPIQESINIPEGQP